MREISTYDQRIIDELKERLLTNENYFGDDIKENVEWGEINGHSRPFGWYYVGRDLQDEKITGPLKRTLQIQNPDFDQRLPWYEIMFDIMDNGRWQITGSGGPYRYDLSKEIEETLEQRILQLGRESRLLRKLSRELAYLPGQQLRPFLAYHNSQGIRRILEISTFLHRPINTFMAGVEATESCADLYYKTVVEK